MTSPEPEFLTRKRRINTDTPLPSDYYDKMRPIVDVQLEKAGIRLAYVLNEIFK
jgi:hypothetical protein